MNQTVNAVNTLDCQFSYLPEMLTARSMHQSCIVRAKTGFWNLLTIGGKSEKTTWLKSVEAIDLSPYLRSGMIDKEGKPITTKWESIKDMNSERSNFSITVVKNCVYVFGG